MTTVTDAAQAARAKALAWIGQGTKRLLIGGQWVDAVSGKTFETINPATEQPLCHVAEADSADVDAAVIAARNAFDAPSWSALSPIAHARAAEDRRRDRGSCRRAGGDRIDRQRHAAVVRTSRSDRHRGYRPLLRGLVLQVLGTTIPSDGSTLIYTLREPLGVCGQIIPWNVPILMAAIKFANALCCGNTVILKPAELACLTSIRLAELIQETDLPPGVINVLPGFGATAGAALAQHPGVDKIAFTADGGRQADYARRDAEPEEGDAGTRREGAQRSVRRRRHRKGRAGRCQDVLRQLGPGARPARACSCRKASMSR